MLYVGSVVNEGYEMEAQRDLKAVRFIETRHESQTLSTFTPKYMTRVHKLRKTILP